MDAFLADADDALSQSFVGDAIDFFAVDCDGAGVVQKVEQCKQQRRLATTEQRQLQHREFKWGSLTFLCGQLCRLYRRD